MNQDSMRYARTSFPTLVYCGTNRMNNALIHDDVSWEDFSEDTVSSYLTDGAEMLASTLSSFVSPDAAYSSLQAKELRFMLEALIEVKEVFANQ